MSDKYRLEGLKRRANNVAEYLKSDCGLMGCDLEVIGALLFTKYKGENKRISELLDDTSKALKEAEEFLKNLKK